MRAPAPHADAVHGARESAREFGLVIVRFEHLGTAINLRSISQHRLLERLDRADRVVVDDWNKVAAKIRRARGSR